MPLLSTKGAASASGLGFTSSSEPAIYIEDVFSTYLYTGNDSTQTITNGIDLSTKGGLVWSRVRNNSDSHWLVDTVRGANINLESNSTNGQRTFTGVTGFTTSGYTVEEQSSIQLNDARFNYVSWTFRKQPKFFDIVTYTGNGVDGRTIASNHNMGSGFLGAVFLKRTDTTSDWKASFRGGQGGQNPWLSLNLTAGDSSTAWVGGNVIPGVNGFSVHAYEGNSSAVNAVGGTYVAYLFAHNAGGFGLTGADNAITCGTYTTDGSGNATVDIGYEPQWLLTKWTNNADNWHVFDEARGFSVNVNGTSGDTNDLYPNSSSAEANRAADELFKTSTGFNVRGSGSSRTYIYIAIRRPMKVPTVATSVFYPLARTGNDTETKVTGVGFSPDLWVARARNIGAATPFFDRLRGVKKRVESNSGNPEQAFSGSNGLVSLNMDGITIGAGALDGGICNDTGTTYGNWLFRRATGFFDQVCYTGTGGASQNYSHNLGVVPELILVKNRNRTSENWCVYHKDLGGAGYYLSLNQAQGKGGPDSARFPSIPTSSVFTVGTDPDNGGSFTYVAYLFATLAGISKVGSYTGTGAAGLQIDCGFSAGARFVMIKRSNTTGDWSVFDTARGINSGADPFLDFNTTGVETTSDDIVDAYSAGFTVNAFNGVNASGGTYIFLAIA